MPRTTRAAAKAADPVAERENMAATPTVEDDTKEDLQDAQESTAPAPAKKSKNKKKGSKKKKNKVNAASPDPEIVAEEDGGDEEEEVDKEKDVTNGIDTSEDTVDAKLSTPGLSDDEPVEENEDAKDQVQPLADALKEAHLDPEAKAEAQQAEPVDESQPESNIPNAIPEAESIEEPSTERAPAQTVEEVTETEPGLAKPERTGAESESTEHIPPESAIATVAHAEPTDAAPSPASEPHDPITEMDALEDALEEANKALPTMEDPLRSPVKKSSRAISPPKTTAQLSSISKPKITAGLRKPAAAQSTLQRSGSIKKPEASKPTSFARSTASRPSMAASKPVAAKLSQSTAARPRPSSVIGDKVDSKDKPVDSLAAKRRPISMQFPTPPPPPKSTKPTTKPSFTLPGEAIAAKLKAAREERLKKEADDDKKKKQFHARPVPSSTKSVAPAVAVKQTAASKARMSMAGGSDKENAPSTDKHASKPTTATNTINKRASMIGAPRPTAVASKRASIMGPPMAPVPTKPRIASLASSVSSLAPVKGKEVFGRDKLDKDTKDKEKKEKEDKTKKAREEAAERSRQLSREFRERQKRKAEMEKVKKTEPRPALVEA